jgi:hypothetical protein
MGRPDMTEAELFAAYQVSSGYSAQCSCGLWIDAKDRDAVAESIEIHNLSQVHQQWREEQDAVEALQRPTRRRCPCCGKDPE